MSKELLGAFDKRMQNIPASIWQKVAKVDEIKGGWLQGASLHPQVLSRLKKFVLITSTGASTRIEGSKLSDEEVEVLMGNLQLHKMKYRDRQEVRGYFELLKNVLEEGKKLDFTESNIRYFHKELLKYADKDERHRGSYKTMDNTVRMFDAAGRDLGVVFQTIPPYLTPKYMSELIDWTAKTFVNSKFHPLPVIGNFVVEFLRIHPFQDGNGRLSRILTNLLMLQVGYDFVPYVSQEKIIEDNKKDYYLALRRTQQTLGSGNEDLIPWLDFFCNICLRQAESARKLLYEENIETILSVKQLAVWHYLQQHNEVTAGEIEAGAAIKRPTVNQALTKLLKLGKIEKIGLGRAVRYRVN